MKRFVLMLCAMCALAAAVPLARGEPTKDALKEQFKARDGELRSMKQRGVVGETIDGYVDAVGSGAAADQKVGALLSEENRDRRALYQLLADEINAENPRAAVRATVETVAERNALRNIERAGPDEFLRVATDQWIRAKDFPRFQKLTKLKTQGKVGETSAGLVEIVQDADRGDKSLSGVVDEENARRTAEYKALAERESADVSTITKRMARRNIDNARIGEMVKDESGTWRKK